MQKCLQNTPLYSNNQTYFYAFHRLFHRLYRDFFLNIISLNIIPLFTIVVVKAGISILRLAKSKETSKIYRNNPSRLLVSKNLRASIKII